MDFGESLGRLLRERGLKQSDLCRMSGIPSSAMSNYIAGKKVPTLTNAIAIADALAISLDELAGRVPPKRTIERELLTCFRDLSDEGQEVAVNTVRGLGVSYKKRYEPNQVAVPAGVA